MVVSVLMVQACGHPSLYGWVCRLLLCVCVYSTTRQQLCRLSMQLTAPCRPLDSLTT